MPEDIIETLNIVGKCKDVESEEYKDAMKLIYIQKLIWKELKIDQKH